MIELTDRSGDVLSSLSAVTDAALGAVGARMAANARMYVPVDTGRLRNSIGYGASGGVLQVGTDVDYAVYVELGRMGHPGSHFLRNAAAGHVGEYAAILGAALGTALKGGEKIGILEEKTSESEG